MDQPNSASDQPPKNKGGRPEGSRTRLQAEAIQAASRTGMLPHEILLDMARGRPQRTLLYKGVNEHGDMVVDEKWVELTIEDRKDAAKAAAPYYAPKLSTVETVRGINDDDLDSLIEQLAAQAGISLSPRGEGTPQPEEERDSGRRIGGRERRRLNL